MSAVLNTFLDSKKSINSWKSWSDSFRLKLSSVVFIFWKSKISTFNSTVSVLKFLGIEDLGGRTPKSLIRLVLAMAKCLRAISCHPIALYRKPISKFACTCFHS